jgi:tRNA A-37 threonylcarbamoyl transferase component Bud32
MSSTDATRISDRQPAATRIGDAALGVDLSSPPVIPDLVIERELGRGGMGAVWLGRQSYLDRAVAVKALTLVGDEAFAARFRREARILAGLAHPHIVACYQAGIAPDGRPFLVMEFVDGPDLRKHVTKHGPFPSDAAARLVAEVAEGLRHAQGQGIIHRDVKPENVLLATRPDGGLLAKLADLGLARPAQTPKGTGLDLTAAGQVLGTPATMAPEQFDDPDGVDQRADIYGLGCVLHYALTGEAAFTGSTFAELVASKVNGISPDPSRRQPGIPKALSQLCVRMLAPRRDDRPGYDEIIATLRSITPAAPAGRPWGLIVGAVAAVIAIAVAIPLLSAGPAPPVPTPDPVPVPIATPEVAQPLPPVATVVPSKPAARPALEAPLELFDPVFERRLRGWNIADPLAWGVSEDVEGFPIAGRAGEIVRSLPALPGRIAGTVSIPESASRVQIGVRDAEGRTTSLLLLPLNGLIASLVVQGVDGADLDSRGSATTQSRRVQFTINLAGGKLTAVIADAAVPLPLVIDLPSPPVAIVLVAESKAPVLFESLLAEP